jgi:hypothetical protein
VTVTSVAVDVLQNTSQASLVEPRTSRVNDDRDTRLNVVTRELLLLQGNLTGIAYAELPGEQPA